MTVKKGLPAFNLKNAKVVILGTFPGELSLCKKEYYVNSGNDFWCLLGLKEHDMNTLKKLHIGLWDVIASCERDGSADRNIRKPKYNDLSDLKGKKIFFNGKSAYKYFLTAQRKQKIDLNVSEKQILISSSSAIGVDCKIKQKQWQKAIMAAK